jgi:hypothetical protein
MVCLAKYDRSKKHQRKLAAVALIIGTFLFNLLEVSKAHSSDSIPSAKIAVTASVPERTNVHIIFQLPELTVTNADIMRGFVVVHAATRIQVKSNNPAGYLLAFEVISTHPAFDGAAVFIKGKEVQLSSGGGWIPQPYIRGGTMFDLSYRFTLAKDARPGTYSWPFMISVLPL